MSDNAGTEALSLVERLIRPAGFAAEATPLPKAGYAIRIALLSAIAYYVSAVIGVGFGFPATATPVFRPPTVILIVALQLIPIRMWGVVLIAGLPAALLAYLPAATPLDIALFFYAGNAAQAVLTALLLRRLCGREIRFDRFISTAWFIVISAFVAPAIAAFTVAALSVTAGWATDFPLVWQARLLTDILSALVALPPVLSIMTSDPARLRQVPAARFLEAGLLALSLVAVGNYVVGDSTPQVQGLPFLLYALLPFLLWAGLRFGVGGVSFCLLIMAVLSLWRASHGIGPFAAKSPVDNVMGLQLFLIALGLPFMLMAALMDERRGAVQALLASDRQIHRLAAQLIRAQEEERRSVARELHDEIGQALTMVKINLGTIRLADNPANAVELLDEGMVLVDRALEQVRDLSLLLRPAMLDDLGLVPALRWLSTTQAERAGYRLSFTAHRLEVRPSREIETICFRVAQEALTNIARHAQARNVTLDLQEPDGQLRLTVHDDGVGFDPDAVRQRAATGRSMGLLGMQERAKLGGGQLAIESAPGQGATLTLSLPYPLTD